MHRPSLEETNEIWASKQICESHITGLPFLMEWYNFPAQHKAQLNMESLKLRTCINQSAYSTDETISSLKSCL